jgi:hypothetical protein
MPGSGWMFVTKRDLEDISSEESEVYPVAYFENGVPWFATPGSSVLRKPGSNELYWGCLVSPGQNANAMWREKVARIRLELRSATDYITTILSEPETVTKGGLSRHDIQEYASEGQGYHAAVVTAALGLPQFGWSTETGVPLVRLMEGH